ncbi:MAG: triple tyrosine motif-containing protein, partial [Flavisolibacter sp.]
FNPATFGQLQRPPKPYLTSVLLGEKYLSIDSLLRQGRIMLDYDNTSIGIYFSALSYLQQTKVHYYYMLDGLDKNWIHTDHPIEAAYNYLPPGEYTFRVKSENTDGITSQEIASIPIVVQPPFWNTRWFYGLVLLVVIGVLYIIDRERMIKKDSLRQMRSEIASNLHTEISNTLNNINVLSEMAKIKADKNIEQSKEFIGQISDKSRHMMEAMDDMLWSIDPQNDSMRKTVLRIKELTDAMRLAYDVDIDLIVDHKIQSLELDMKLRHDLFFFYKESMNYLMESIHCRQVFVNIKQVKSKMMIEVLTECEHTTEAFKSRFRKFLEKRTRTLPSSMEITADHKSLSVVLFVNLKN